MKNILLFGDSNTWGYIPGDAGQRFGIEERWTGLLQKELGSNYRIIDEGLNGRTTVIDDLLEGAGRNGLSMLSPLLETHSPLDHIVVMLGTNDLKNRFALSSFDIALGLIAIVREIKRMCATPPLANYETSPAILVIVPPPILEVGPFKDAFIGGAAKSQGLYAALRSLKKDEDFEIIDAGSIVSSSEVDGIHLSLASHRKLGMHLAQYFKGKYE